jgi:hypothetical protein
MDNKHIFKRFLKEIGLYHEFCKCLKLQHIENGKDPFDTLNFESSFKQPSTFVMIAFGWDISKFKGWCDIYGYLSAYCYTFEQMLDEEIITSARNIVKKYDR